MTIDKKVTEDDFENYTPSFEEIRICILDCHAYIEESRDIINKTRELITFIEERNGIFTYNYSRNLQFLNSIIDDHYRRIDDLIYTIDAHISDSISQVDNYIAVDNSKQKAA